MIRTSYDAPDTLQRPDAWQKQAACRTEDPDLFFPEGTTGRWALAIEQAKAVCRRCPATDACLAYAIETGATHGIFGALDADERRPGNLPQPTQDATSPTSLEEAFRRRSTPIHHGHRIWYGAPKFKWKGTTYNALHVAFYLARGRYPEGPIRRSCTHGSCYEGAHLTDGRLRDENALCGTRSGYARHKKRGEKACQPCRSANTAADKRWRQTGSTRAG